MEFKSDTDDAFVMDLSQRPAKHEEEIPKQTKKETKEEKPNCKVSVPQSELYVGIANYEAEDDRRELGVAIGDVFEKRTSDAQTSKPGHILVCKVSLISFKECK